MMKYKIDIIQAFKNNGITTYKIKQDKLLNGSTVKKLYDNDTSITIKNLESICKLLNCQPGDLLEYVPDDAE